MNKKALGAFIILAGTFSSQVFANEKWEVSLGLALNSAPQYAGGDSFEVYVFPILDAIYHFNENSTFYVGTVNGLGVEETLGRYTLGAGIGYRYGLYGPEDFVLGSDGLDMLKGMDYPDDTEVLKLSVRTVNEVWNFKLEYDHGLRNNNSGRTVKLDATYSYYFNSRLFGKLGAHTTWANDRFVNDYYGVSGNEITTFRKGFVGNAGFYRHGVLVETNYIIQQQHIIYTSFNLSTLSNWLQKSGLVRKKFQPEMTLAYIYLF